MSDRNNCKFNLETIKSELDEWLDRYNNISEYEVGEFVSGLDEPRNLIAVHEAIRNVKNQINLISSACDDLGG